MQYILLTGASTGIGNATAQHLAKQGYTVFAGIRNEKDAAILRGYSLPNLQPIQLDITKKEDIETAFKHIEKTVGSTGLAAVINNAGINYIAPFELSDEAKVRHLMEVNFFGLMNVSQRFLPLLQQFGKQNKVNSAKLINIGSVGSTIGIPWEFSYHASKFAVLGLTESLRFELEALDIVATCILPGGIRTPFFTKSGENTEASKKALTGANADYYANNMSKMWDAAQQFERFATPPEKVAAKIENAIKSRKPPLKILVGLDARIIYFLTKV
jgi:NAD(P)-dependent dehydrogenase (short-subunit alcohol dehydrogenase family)